MTTGAYVTTDLKYAQVPEWVIFHSSLSPQAIRLYLVLTRYADQGTREAYPSRSRLARDMGVSVKTVDRALAELIAASAVTVVKRTDEAGDPTSSRYIVHFSPPEGVPSRATRGGDTSDATGDTSDRGGDTNDATGSPSADATGGDTDDALTRPTLNETQEEQPAATAAGDTDDAHLPIPLPPAGETADLDEKPPPSAGHLVAAWCEGWTESRGRQPDPSVVKRVAGACQQIAKTRTSRDSWVTAWEAAKAAGRSGRHDVVAHLADYRPPQRARPGTAAAIDWDEQMRWASQVDQTNHDRRTG